MALGGKGATEFFDLLESNKLGAVEEMKKVFHEHFLSTKDNWLVNGLFDYYLSTNSLRAVEVLVGVREPHDKYLLDRLAEALTKPGSSGQSQRVQALTLLGHVVRRHPTWLYKLANHALFDKLLKLLKVDGEILALMSALLLLVTLLPMLPVYLNPYLNEIFEVFARLAQYYDQQSLALASASNSGSAYPEAEKDKLYLLHLQIGLDSLFHRLYAMYPCNFVSFLKTQYTMRDQFPTFTRVVRPMLDSVRMHPLLVTASKDTEISTSRWKRMEHHDVVAECGRFTFEKSWGDLHGPTATHPRSLYTSMESSAHSRGLISSGVGVITTVTGEEGFWSPSMMMAPNSPPPHETRSTPSTPNNMRIGASPPEAAVEATPETTPVKDLRQLSTRQAPSTSAAVRALSSFGNGLSSDSRPSTPTAFNLSVVTAASNKINKIVAERQSSQMASWQTSSLPVDSDPSNDRLRELRDLDAILSQNGSNDSWQEDQEVLEIVNSQGNSGGPMVRSRLPIEEKEQSDAFSKIARTDLSRKVHRIRFYSQCQTPLTYKVSCTFNQVRRTNSWPEITAKSDDSVENLRLVRAQRNKAKVVMEEASTQTYDIVPYEYLLLGVVSSRVPDQSNESTSDSRLSLDSMLQRYIQACGRVHYCQDHPKPKSGIFKNSKHQKQKKKGNDDDSLHEGADEEGGDHGTCDPDGGSQLLQLLQLQLQFERQRREVHAERNRRLLGKLRDSQALEEHNDALKDRLRIVEKEAEALRTELERTKRESRQAEKRHTETLGKLQVQCADEQQKSRELARISELLKLELDDEREKVSKGIREVRSAEAALFDAAHQLKGAMRAANQGKMLKCAFDTLQKRYLLLGEVQLKLQEKTVGPTPMASQEAAQIQRSYAEELSSLRRQVESRNSLVEALRARLIELEGGEVQREAILAKQHQLLREAKERHEAELDALESKYKAQRAINLHLESRVLELLGMLEEKSALASAGTTNTLSSISPKERSPPLSVSLASSSEGSIAFMHSGIMMSDCEHVGEITNLQAIVDPTPSPSRNNPQQQNQQPPPTT